MRLHLYGVCALVSAMEADQPRPAEARPDPRPALDGDGPSALPREAPHGAPTAR